jgi:hypothetical protein
VDPVPDPVLLGLTLSFASNYRIRSLESVNGKKKIKGKLNLLRIL